MSMFAKRPNLMQREITPDDLILKCIEVDHIDPDTQPKDEEA
jgi:hypothetical protein